MYIKFICSLENVLFVSEWKPANESEGLLTGIDDYLILPKRLVQSHMFFCHFTPGFSDQQIALNAVETEKRCDAMSALRIIN